MTALVTVVTVSTHPDTATWMDDPFSDEAMATIHSVQEQTTEAHDLIILRRLDGTTPIPDLYQFGAERAETEWLTFVEEGRVLPPDYLERLLALVDDGLFLVGGSDTGVLVRKSYYLEGM